MRAAAGVCGARGGPLHRDRGQPRRRRGTCRVRQDRMRPGSARRPRGKGRGRPRSPRVRRTRPAAACIGGAIVMTIAGFETRRARASDADGIAVAHRDSIRSIGARFYSPEVVDDWSAVVTRDLYVNAMEGGEVFFIAVGEIDGKPAVLGFATHRIDGAQHGTSVY